MLLGPSEEYTRRKAPPVRVLLVSDRNSFAADHHLWALPFERGGDCQVQQWIRAIYCGDIFLCLHAVVETFQQPFNACKCALPAEPGRIPPGIDGMHTDPEIAARIPLIFKGQHYW